MAWDAAGRPIRAWLEVEGGLAVRVDTAGARFPVSVDPLLSTATSVASGSDADNYAWRIGGVGDVNGDGYDDVGVGGCRAVGGVAAAVFYGSASGARTAGATRLGYGPVGDRPEHLRSLGDVNGDGYPDLPVAFAYGGGGSVHLGGAGGVSTAPHTSWLSTSTVDRHVAPAGDVDGDGRVDVVVLAEVGTTQTLFLYRGRSGRWPATTAADTLGESAVGFADPDPRGRPRRGRPRDLALSVDHAVYVHYGTSGPVDADADGALQADDCDDLDAERSPGFTETCGDAIDNDCNGIADDCSSVQVLVSEADGHVAGDEMDGRLSDVAALGDVDGDGLGDFAASAADAAAGRGEVYLFSGAVGDATVASALATLSPSSTLHLGRQLEAAGDMDGDGLGDLFMSTTGNGRWYLCAAPFSTVTVSSSVCPLVLNPNGSDAAGYVETGDLTGDGVPDVVFRSDQLDNSTGANRGGAYLLAGPIVGTARQADAVATLTGSRDDSMTGSGAEIADLDGDGQDDLLISGTWDAGRDLGAIGVVLGPWDRDLSLDQADAYMSEATADTWWIYGDLVTFNHDGDGYLDIAAAIHGAHVAVWNGPLLERTDLDSQDATIRPEVFHRPLTELAPVGDLDGDGRDDLLLGDPENDTWGADGSGRGWGAAYPLLGPFAGEADPVALPGWTLVSEGQEYLGSSVAAGDLDGGGLADLLVGASYGDGAVRDGGDVFLFRGERI